MEHICYQLERCRRPVKRDRIRRWRRISGSGRQRPSEVEGMNRRNHVTSYLPVDPYQSVPESASGLSSPPSLFSRRKYLHPCRIRVNFSSSMAVNIVPALLMKVARASPCSDTAAPVKAAQVNTSGALRIQYNGSILDRCFKSCLASWFPVVFGVCWEYVCRRSIFQNNWQQIWQHLLSRSGGVRWWLYSALSVQVLVVAKESARSTSAEILQRSAWTR